MSDKAIEVIKKHLDDMLAAEVIDGDSIADVLEFVDLDVAFSPVIEVPLADTFGPMGEVEVRKWPDGLYAMVWPGESPDFKVISEPLLKIMRARYLLHSKARQRRQFAGTFKPTDAEANHES